MEMKVDSQETMEGQVQLWKHVKGFVDSGTLRCALQLRLPDAIHNHGRPISFPDLAAALALSIPSLNHDRLYRILRYLVYIDLFRCVHVDGEPHYTLSPASKLLVTSSDQQQTLAPFASFILRPDSIQMMQFLKESLEGPQTPLQRFLGLAAERSQFKWAEEDSACTLEYMDVMRGGTAIMAGELVRALKESGAATGAAALVDVGGNTGQVAEALVGAFPHLKCSVLELPHVVDAISAPPPNIEFVKGDMFVSVPKSDIVFMKSVLHDWNDEDCLKLLKKCKEAIAASKRGKVIVVDIVLGSDSADGFASARFSMEMLMFVIGGKERTGEEWKNLIQNAGFSKYEILPMKALESVILLYP
ncbi:hypothetical protein ACLOJK_029670 [Asimina triloba]